MVRRKHAMPLRWPRCWAGTQGAVAAARPAGTRCCCERAQTLMNVVLHSLIRVYTCHRKRQHGELHMQM
jgi:hypothetical protein